MIDYPAAEQLSMLSRAAPGFFMTGFQASVVGKFKSRGYGVSF